MSEKTEKTTKLMRVFESTDILINKYRGELSYAQFMSRAVEFYIKHCLDDNDTLSNIYKSIEQINERQTTNLGLLCEVLRQMGILNGNGEVEFLKKNQ